VTISPSRIGRSSFARLDAGRVDALHAVVHFSITPRLRTVTSGLRMPSSGLVVWSAYCRKLKRRTLYGQLFEQ
jgi:hypothetical protein